MKKIVIIGPAYPLRGGLATFNQRLAKEFTDEGHECTIYSFSLQYPSFLFPGTTQYSSDPAPEGISIKTRINSINPFNWIAIGGELKKQRPDIIVVRYWLPFMGPALGTILRIVRRNRHTKIIAITDNVIPHEKRPGDIAFTKYFLKACHGFITMSSKVMNDLRRFQPQARAEQVLHPLYDNFGEPVNQSEARRFLALPEDKQIFLFFGFIRKYKGLDILLQAYRLLKDRQKARLPLLLIAGEFYEDGTVYTRMIEELELSDNIILRTNFIPDSEVRYYLGAADLVIQPYRNATQSGVTPLAYHFEVPMIVTNVGSLPDLVPHERSGLVAEPTAEAIAESIERFLELGKQSFIPHLRSEKKKYSWSNLVKAIFRLAGESTCD